MNGGSFPVIALYPCRDDMSSTILSSPVSHLVSARRAQSDLEVFSRFPHPEWNSPLDGGLLRGARGPGQALLPALKNTVNHQTPPRGYNSN